MKKIITVFIVLAVALCLVTATPVNANTQKEEFRVGFARVDINPYVVEGDLSSGMMELPLRGVGDTWNRLSESHLLDDNGDGKIDENDGLSATCIAISDSSGNTVLMITIDLIGGDRVSNVKTEICARVEEAIASGELSDVKLTADQIYYAGTHTHNAPDVSVYSASGKTGFNNDGKDLSVVNKNLGLWLDRTVKHLGDAAIRALKDRSEATLTKYASDASEDTKAPVKGKVMNTVRHYNNYDSKGNIVCVAGDNFNTRGSNPKPVTPVDDTLYMMYFDFAAHNQKTGENKLPIVVANWRGHPSLNNSDTSYYGDRNAISSDYINAFCHALEYNCTVDNTGKGYYGAKQVYRVAFFQGAGGNVNPRSQQVVGGTVASKWIDDMSASNKECRGNGYGRILCALAKHGLNTDGETVTPGPVKTMAYTLSTDRKTFGITALAYEAAVAYQENPAVSLPFAYTNEEGQTYVIGSKYHANAVVSRWNPTLQKSVDSPATLALNAIMIGDGLAMVTVPGEPFDYYFNEDGSNAWDNLINEATYGKPWILSLCNGCSGYVPNNKAYTYNDGSTKWTTGSYESHTTSYDIGTGETMVQVFGNMLQMLRDDTAQGYQASCQHCDGQVVNWEPFQNQTSLDSGHYFLIMDTFTAQIAINKNQKVCFDLNGYTIKGGNRVFYTSAKGNSVLSIMDSSDGQTGKALGSGAQLGVCAGFGGMTVVVDSGNTLNLYSGTLGAYDRQLYNVGSGGTLYVNGTFNMYGGTVEGGKATSFTGQYLSGSKISETTRNGKGAAIYLSGSFNAYGGKVTAGTAQQIVGKVMRVKDGYRYAQSVTPIDAVGACVYVTGKVTVGGDVQIADLYFAESSAKAFTVDVSDAPFTGNVRLTYGMKLSTEAEIGKCTGEMALAEKSITLSQGEVAVTADGSRLQADVQAAVMDSNGTIRYYSSLQDALDAQTEYSYIILYDDVETAISVVSDKILDLQGYTISGDVVVAEGATLYCLDSVTNDCETENYGLIKGDITGTVIGKPALLPGDANWQQPLSGAAYLVLSDGEGMSFHRVYMQLRTVSFRPSNAGIYYTADFGSDQKVAQQIRSFGIVVNAQKDPRKEPSLTGGGNLCVTFDSDAWEEDSFSGAMVSGILKQGNTVAVNKANAATPVYVCTFVQLMDGSYCYGPTVSYSLQQLLEMADEENTIPAADEGLGKLYHDFFDVLDSWNIPRLRALYPRQ